MRYEVGQRVKIKTKEELKKHTSFSSYLKFAGLTGIIGRIDDYFINRYSVKLDNDNLNCKPYEYEGEVYTDSGKWWEGKMLIPLNINRRLS